MEDACISCNYLFSFVDSVDSCTKRVICLSSVELKRTINIDEIPPLKNNASECRKKENKKRKREMSLSRNIPVKKEICQETSLAFGPKCRRHKGRINI